RSDRDWSSDVCSSDLVQMHEQKLIEVSLTKELLEAELASARGRTAETLRGDLEYLARMEAESEKFGAATGLDSVSTFECIVEGRSEERRVGKERSGER